ncbi:MAG: alpha-amylase family glycosyl hydrolase [Ginsengibacter sp.]
MKKISIYNVVFTAIILFTYSCNTSRLANAVPGEKATSFTHPAWSEQSNIYEVNVRQYSKEGTFKAFEKSLPRLKEMGVEILWFMPITPIGVEDRKMDATELGSYYAVKNYKEVNPEFGTMVDWKSLVKHAQGMGFKVITDWVANHSAPDNPWIKNHPDFYTRDSSGKIISPFDWTDTRKLNYNNRELRDSMIAAMKFWLNETGIDGFRCDVAEEVPADFWKDCITDLKKVKNVFMLAEGEKPALHYAGFDATYTWTVMQGMKDIYDGKKSLKSFDSILNHNISIFPQNAYRMFFTSNHDENSWNGTEFEKYGDAYKTFAVLTQTMYQSIPLIYSGQEAANHKRLKFFVKDPIEWKSFEVGNFYKTLLYLREKNKALRADASYRKLATGNDNAIFSYVRQYGKSKLLVILNLSSQPQNFTIKDEGIKGNATNVFTGGKESLNEDHPFNLGAWGWEVYEL